MDYIFPTGRDQKHIVYSMAEHIVLRSVRNEFMSRPTYLCHDYSSSLCCVLHNHIIHYAYITLNDTLDIRQISRDKYIFRLEPDECHRLRAPILTIFNNKLILFYCWENPIASTWNVSYIISPETNSDEAARVVDLENVNISQNATTNTAEIINHVLNDLPYLPEFSILNTGSHLIINVQGNNENHVLELTSHMTLISHDDIRNTMEQQSHFQLERIKELQNDIEKLQQASSLMMNKISDLLQENERLHQECSALHDDKNKFSPRLTAQEKEIHDLTSSLNETKKALTIREAQIESAKQQYNELMDVAQKYREEAIKWRMKLISK